MLSVSPVTARVVPVVAASETSEDESQLPEDSFHWTVYPVRLEPPSEAGACQDTTRASVPSGETLRLVGDPGTVNAGATAWMAARVSDLVWPASRSTTTTMMRMFFHVFNFG